MYGLIAFQSTVYREMYGESGSSQSTQLLNIYTEAGKFVAVVRLVGSLPLANYYNSQSTQLLTMKPRRATFRALRFVFAAM